MFTIYGWECEWFELVQLKSVCSHVLFLCLSYKNIHIIKYVRFDSLTLHSVSHSFTKQKRKCLFIADFTATTFWHRCYKFTVFNTLCVSQEKAKLKKCGSSTFDHDQLWKIIGIIFQCSQLNSSKTTVVF